MLAPLKPLAKRLPASLVRTVRRAIANRRDREVIAALEELNVAIDWESPPCSICGERETRIHTVKNGFRIVECVADGLLYVSPRPIDVSPFYDSRYYRGGVPGVYESYATHADKMHEEWSRRLSLLESGSGPGRRLLDVGAATGNFVALAATARWDAKGIELSEWAAEQAREKFGVDVVSGSLPDSRFRPGQFDVVTMWDCIEHLSQPGDVLVAIRTLLDHGGLLAITTGAVDHRDPRGASGWYYPPWHLYYFSRETVSELLRRAGFEMTEYIVQDEASPYAIMTVTARPVASGSY